jgi:DNA-binding transcriptional regulator YiaG
MSLLEDWMMIFGVDFSRFRILREAIDMSQAKVADLAGISQGKVSKEKSNRPMGRLSWGDRFR